MDSTQQDTGSSDVSRSRGTKTDKTRRSWSAKEEVVLINALKELVADGWKSDNGFRAGFLGKLEDALKKEFPGTDLKASPHINSKIGTWKKNYYSLTAMVGRSGVGFNPHGDYMIDCNNDQWDQIVKVDSNARNMRYKSWPLFEDWKVIFGKDRATGDKAEDIMEAVNEMMGRNNLTQGVNEDDQAEKVHVEDETEQDLGDDSFCQSQRTAAPVRTADRKRKQDDPLDGVYELLLELGRNTDKRLEHIGNRIGYEFDLSKARTEVYETLNTIPGLPMDDKFEVCEILVDKVERLELFMSLPEEARTHYLMRVLEMRGK